MILNLFYITKISDLHVTGYKKKRGILTASFANRIKYKNRLVFVVVDFFKRLVFFLLFEFLAIDKFENFWGFSLRLFYTILKS